MEMLSSKVLKKSRNKTIDKEISNPVRNLSGGYHTFFLIVAAGLSLFSIYINGFTNTQEIYRNIIFVGFLMLLTFLLYPAGKKSADRRMSLMDIIFTIFGLAGIGYILFFYSIIHIDRHSQAILTDYIFAIITIIVLLEAARRTIGIFIPLLSIIAIIYALFGPYFPGMFSHSGFTMKRFLYRMYMTSEGIFGITLSIASTYIILFILFGAFLSASGASKFFNDLSLAIAGQKRGGPAQVAVISSALTGSLSGSAVANVATTGTFTIPLMRGIGLSPRFAGAVEAAASTGGMVMPPIMGAAAFIMAGFLGVSYTVIILAAIIPSILYYGSLIIAIDLEAKKLGLKGINKDSIPKVWDVIKESGALGLPIIVVISTLLTGKTPLFAGFAGIISVIVASWLTKNKENRITIKKALAALVDGAKGSIQVGIACSAIGIIIAVVTMTGLGSTIAFNILAFSGGTLWIILLLVMFTCIVLSMGLPSTALYIVVAVTAAPALINAGVHPIAAHFFVFWFGALSNVTPPVALASYTAAGIAGADAMKTSWTALRLTLPGFIIPFMIAYNPIMIMQSPDGNDIAVIEVILVLISGILGIFSLAVAISNFFSTRLYLIERIGFFGSSLLLIKPGLVTDILGISVMALLVVINIGRARKTSTATTAA